MEKSKTYGVIGTIIISALILLLLILFGLSITKEEIEKEDGIEINFGGGLLGAPSEEPTTEPVEAASEPIPSPPVEASPPAAITQVDPSVALEAQKKRKEERAKKEQVRQEQVRQEKIRREQETKARKEKAIADAKAAQEAKAKSMAKNAFGGKGNDQQGSGTSGGGDSNTPGNPLGRGTAGGNSWSLAGRNLSSSFYKPPYIGNQEGKIVVSITVNKNGDVIAANIKQGTTISEERLREECKKAAKKLRFSMGSKVGNSIGEITYRFRQQ